MVSVQSERWERLAGDLAGAGVEARVFERALVESRWGRVVHGVSRSITIRLADGGLVEVHDQWWSKSPDVWVGWAVTRSDRSSITKGRVVVSKKRSEIVAAVLAATGPDRVEKVPNEGVERPVAGVEVRD